MRRFKGGRRRPIAVGPRFRLKNYLQRSLPNPPATWNGIADAMPSVNDVYLNDKYGCCVIAGGYHIEGVLTGNSGVPPIVYSDAQVVMDYSAIGGFDPNNPQATDNGCDEVTALNYWQNNGFPSGNKIAGWMSVNAADAEETRIALWLFENLMYGVELPDAWVNNEPSQSGFTWDVAGDPDPQNGHCYIGAGYDSSRITIVEWGMYGYTTDAATAKYAVQSASGSLYTVISMDAINKASQKAPNGFDYSQLVADFDSMGGHVAA